MKYIGILVAISLMMAVVQWLAAPHGGGAANSIYMLEQTGHVRSAAVLRMLHESRLVRAVDDVWQRVINAPRNRLLTGLGMIERPDMIHFYGASHRWPRDNFRDAMMFAVGTTLVYTPVAILAAWFVTRRRKTEK